MHRRSISLLFLCITFCTTFLAQTAEPNDNVTQHGYPQFETSIAVHPLDASNLVVGFMDLRYTCGASPRFNCTAVGVGWFSNSTWTVTPLREIHPGFNKYGRGGDPAVVASRSGVFYYPYIDHNGAGGVFFRRSRLVVARSAVGGQTWPISLLTTIAEDTLLVAGAVPFNDKPSIAVDNTGGPYDGNVYASWTRNEINQAGNPPNVVNRIYFARSTNGGTSFSAPQQLSVDNQGNSQHPSAVAVGPDGEVYVAWSSQLNNGATANFYIAKSTSGGQWFPFGPRLLVVGDPLPSPLPNAGFTMHSFPTIAVDHAAGVTRGTVYVAWADEVGNGNGPDILIASTTDGGVTPCEPTRVSNDVNGQYQWFPQMTVDANGVIDVVFYDRRDADAAPPHQNRFNLYRARSIDAGRTFAPNVRVTTEVSIATIDSILGCCLPNTWIGDYNGMVATTSTARPFWADVRASVGNCEGFTTSIPIEGCSGTADVIPPSMQGFNSSGPNPGDMSVHFVFDVTKRPLEFKIKYRRTFPQETPWQELTCSALGSTCALSCPYRPERIIIENCAKYRYEWQAAALNCQG